MTTDSLEQERFIRAMLSARPDGHYTCLGLRVVEVQPRRLRMAMDWQPALGDEHGDALHTGALTALLDTCAGHAAGLALDELGVTSTVDLRVDYLAPLQPGQAVYADAVVSHSRGAVIFTRAIAHQGQPDCPVALACGNFYRLDGDRFADVRAHFHHTGRLPLGAFAVTTEDQPDSRPCAFLAATPYADFLSVKALAEPACYLLPAQPVCIGNPMIPSLHGGALAGFMSLAASAELLRATGSPAPAELVDMHVDYLRSGEVRATRTRCELRFIGRRLANVAVTAWQRDEARPIATARLQFMLSQAAAE